MTTRFFRYPGARFSPTCSASGSFRRSVRHLLATAAKPAWPPIDATFLFTADVHTCLVSGDTLSPNCAQEGKTDANLLRHVAAVNRIAEYDWPTEIGGVATGLAGAGKKIATPLGLVIGGDMTDDGGGQVKVPGEGHQLLQFSSRYQQGTGPDRVHFPVYNGLGNHDLDQDGAPPHIDWYRRELRDYVELNHRQTVFYKPPVAVANYDIEFRQLFLGLGRPASGAVAAFRRRHQQGRRSAAWAG